MIRRKADVPPSSVALLPGRKRFSSLLAVDRLRKRMLLSPSPERRCCAGMQRRGANDNRVAVDAPPPADMMMTGLAWRPISERPPTDRELLLWVHGPFVGHWNNAEGGVWMDKTSGAHLCPVRYWAYITPP